MQGRTRRIGWTFASCVAICCACVVAPVASPAATPAKKKKCKTGQSEVLYQPRPGKPALKICARVKSLPRTPAAIAVTIEGLLSSGKLISKRLRRVLPKFPAKLERRFARAREAQLRRMPAGALARAAATSGEGTIPAPAGKAGFGWHSESSDEQTGQDADRLNTRFTRSSSSRHEAFGPACADFDGNVVTDIKTVDRTRRATEKSGKRTVVEIEARVTGKLSGGFTDAFELRGPLTLELDFVVETRSWTEVALTGKVLRRAGTETKHVVFTGTRSGTSIPGQSHPAESLTSSTLTGAGGSKGILSIDQWTDSFTKLLAGSLWLAEVEGRLGFTKTIENMNNFKCVKAEATPSSLTLAKGTTAPFTLVVKGLDDGRPLPSVSHSSVFSGNLTVDPLSDAVSGPASGTIFKVTNNGGKGVIKVAPRSRRGRAPTVEVPVEEPGGYTYRILKATQKELITARKDGFAPSCEFSNIQNNLMTLTDLALPAWPMNRLIQGPGGGERIGNFVAIGIASAGSTVHGCDLGSEEFPPCVRLGSGTFTSGVQIQVTLPTDGPAKVHWFLNNPFAGLGDERGTSTCHVIVLGWTIDDDSTLGDRTVPRSVFESDTPQTISIDADYDLTDPVGAQIHASQTYTMTLLRVPDEGAPF